MTTTIRRAIFCFAVVPMLPLASQAADVTPPHTMAELRQLVAKAVAEKAQRIVIPPGIYRGGPKEGEKTHLTIINASDLEIVADGATMLCTRMTRAMEIHGCTNLTLRGLTIDYDPLPFTQGDVAAVSPADGWLDVKIHKGYPIAPYTRVDIVDRDTRYRKKDSPYMWQSKAEVRESGMVRLHNRAAARFAQVGDLASLGGYDPRGIPHALAIDDSARVTLSRVTVHASNCMGIIASGGEGGHRFLACSVVPGPPPPGAVEPRILSTCADAIYAGPMRRGVITEDCTIRDAGDDSWSAQANGFIFRYNRVRSSGRILIKAAGLVEGNTIEGPFGVSANPEKLSAAEISEIVIRNNVIRDAHSFNPFWDSPQAGAISITADDGRQFRPAGFYGRVVIENNTIEGGNGAAIVVTSARDVTIRGNRLLSLLKIPPNNTGGKYHVDNRAAVWLAQCEDVILRDNELLDPGPEMSQPVVCGPGVKKLEGGLIGKESQKTR